MARRIGFLHTVPGLAGTFDELLKAQTTSVEALHLVDASLLQRAIDSGVDAAVQADVTAHVAHLAQTRADLVLITCSSIGETARPAQAAGSVPVVRVDEAMARHAVEIARRARDSAKTAENYGGRIAVLATLASTLGPTSRLVESHASGDIAVTADVVAGAAQARARGDHGAHDQAVAAAIQAARQSADVVVLAQASMAQALETDGDEREVSNSVPVLSSPQSGLEYALAQLEK